ncbi:MAG: hypothetical protein U0232_01395 [Thermomicrobiales bacterium]
MLGELDAAAGRQLDAAGALTGALALADACAAPWRERALTLLALAERRRGANDDCAARTALDEGRALLERLGRHRRWRVLRRCWATWARGRSAPQRRVRPG